MLYHIIVDYSTVVAWYSFMCTHTSSKLGSTDNSGLSKVAQLITDNPSVYSTPAIGTDSAPLSAVKDFHTSFVVAGTTNQPHRLTNRMICSHTQ